MSVRRRRVWAFAIVVILVGAVFATPAQAHFTASISHIIEHAKKVFYTKSEANSRFVNVGETASDADKLDGLDSTAFLPADATAVDSDQLDGLDSSAFLGASDKAADADQLDGLDSAAFAQKLGNVVTVAESGGDFTSIQSAVDSVTDSDLGNPYLILVGPGFYFERVALKSGMVLQGAGAALTRISTTGADACADGYGVKTAVGSEVRDLTVQVSTGKCAVGLLNVGFATHHYDITILVDNATDNAKGVVSQGGQVFLTRVDIQSTASFAVMDATAEGIVTTGSATAVVVQSSVRSESPSTASYAIHNTTSNAIVQDSTISATGTATTRIGIFSDGMAANSVRVERSRVSGATNSIKSGPGYTTEVLFTQLDQIVSGSVTCVAVIDESLAFNASTCT